MNEWISELDLLAAAGESSVLLTVAGVRGSAPREPGAKMIVTTTQTIGTIGGGQLEYQCVRIASEQLRAGEPPDQTRTRRFALGTGCGQCCGGVVEVMFEYLEGSRADWLGALREQRDSGTPFVMATSTREGSGKFLVGEEPSQASRDVAGCPPRVVSQARELLAAGKPAVRVDEFLLEPIGQCGFHIAVFGAGHVGAATVDVLSRLDCRIRWIDSRRNLFPRSLPANVLPIESDDPAREASAMPAGSFFLVMTHSHPLDLDICVRILRQDDFAYCGLIGSVSKRRRFERLMSKQGVPGDLLGRLVCPIGVPGIDGKKPVEIALAVAAEVLQVRDATQKRGSARVRIEALG